MGDNLEGKLARLLEQREAIKGRLAAVRAQEPEPHEGDIEKAIKAAKAAVTDETALLKVLADVNVAIEQTIAAQSKAEQARLKAERERLQDADLAQIGKVVAAVKVLRSELAAYDGVQRAMHAVSAPTRELIPQRLGAALDHTWQWWTDVHPALVGRVPPDPDETLRLERAGKLASLRADIARLERGHNLKEEELPTRDARLGQMKAALVLMTKGAK